VDNRDSARFGGEAQALPGLIASGPRRPIAVKHNLRARHGSFQPITFG
jgi:hypothetical protein